MTTRTDEPMQPTLTRVIDNQAEAQRVIGHVSDVMDALIRIVDEETRLVRAGRLTEVARLRPEKTDLARRYLADTARLQASQAYLAKAVPGVLRVLRERHTTFRNMLQINLTVLATAHAVSEGIVRGVSDEINRTQAPQTYGASGRAAPAKPKNRQPMAISRTL